MLSSLRRGWKPTKCILIREFSKAKKGKSTSNVTLSGNELYDKEKLERNISGALLNLQKVLNSMRPGRADPSMFDHVLVDAYQQKMPLPQVAQVAVSAPAKLAITVYDPQLVQTIETAVRQSNECFSPSIQGQTIHVTIPKISQEVRQNMIKELSKHAEKTKQQLRRVRQDFLNDVKKHKDDTPEDMIRLESDKIEKVIKESSAKILKIIAAKEKDLQP